MTGARRLPSLSILLFLIALLPITNNSIADTDKIKKEYELLFEMNKFDNRLISKAEKRKEWKAFIKKHPPNNPYVIKAKKYLGLPTLPTDKSKPKTNLHHEKASRPPTKLQNSVIETPLSEPQADESKTNQALMIEGVGNVYYPSETLQLLKNYPRLFASRSINGIDVFEIKPNPQTKKSTWVEANNKTVVDKTTGLMWMIEDFRKLEGRAPNNWKETIKWQSKINSQDYGGHDNWRLPTINELKGIYDPQRTGIAFRNKVRTGLPQVFDKNAGYWYWSSQEYGEDLVWAFGFYSGTAAVVNKTVSYPFSSVRLVRKTDGQ